MTYREYRMKYGEIEHVLIRMTDSFPYFKEKVIMKNGIARVENNYHIVDMHFGHFNVIKFDQRPFSDIDSFYTSYR